MTDDFDPYYKWLGIPSEEQPPSHYRLLGLRLFEENADVIEGAADREMVHLRTFQSGQRAELSQKLLNEVAQAKSVLLDAGRKALYDGQLRSEKIARQAQRTKRPLPPAQRELKPAPAPDVALVAPGPRERAAKPSFVLPIVIGAAAVCLVLVGIAARSVLLNRQPRDETPLAAAPPTVSDDALAIVPPPDPPVTPPVFPPENDPTPEPAPPPVVEEPPLIDKPPPETPLTPIVEPSRVNEPPVASEPVVPQPPPKPSVPDAETREAKRRLLATIYPLDNVRKPADKILLATELLKVAADTATDPDGQFVMWNAARELAIASGKVRTAYAAIDEMAKRYDVDAAALRSAALQQAIDAPAPPAEKVEAMQAGVEQIDAWLADDRYAEAGKLSATLLDLARRARQKELQAALVARRERSQSLGEAFDQCEAALVTLAASPDDPAANLTAGQFFALAKGNWRRGLALLSRGGESQLAVAARLDLARPADASAQVEVADAWWSAAAELSEQRQAAARARSAGWYARALPNLTGIARAKAQTRLAELAAAGIAPLTLPGDSVDTARMGGGGGGPFREVSADRAPIVGFKMNYRVGCVKYIQAQYLTASGVVDGDMHGHPGGGGGDQSVLAKEGYAVGGIVTKSGNRIDGFRVIFMRIDGDRLDHTDRYDSEWFGGLGGGGETLLGGTGQMVIGLYGQQGADLDGMGLVLGVVDPDGAPIALGP